ncbi:pyridoxine 5'-phosphate synthase [Membranihabitans marinus]|uniref:pyridoxine 5'-phosphate synthase n=1 Tax=Membranihabitans marinus TaxID=1227546 RepID=UPI001F00401E|nr:pyridoxine 5'-phosphate synthase [Membranihabitans marinus]
MKTKLSVNINKVALIRNARGEGRPDLLQFALDCETFGADGITVHPRPDERHVRYDDIPVLKSAVKTELNIEGNPNQRFLDMVLKHRPHQCTLVPDAADALTSNQGWDTITYAGFLTDVITDLKKAGIRVSIFIDDDAAKIEGAAKVGADRIEFYTGPYAQNFKKDRFQAISPYVQAAEVVRSLGLGMNAGHDLDLENLSFLVQQIPDIDEVSIGHALISDALYYGIHNTIQMYQNQL